MIKKYLFIGLITVSVVACTNNTPAETQEAETVKSEVEQEAANVEQTAIVEVYNFHGDRRCRTCKAVGNVAQQVVDSIYKDNAAIAFQDINIDKPENAELADEFQATGSGLYLRYNVADSVIIEDVTEFAFMNAIRNPEELSTLLQEKIDSRINE